ncbi:MAG: MFS transporter [Streptomycetaceae bacterium]|nr:MFS transporter [Streptomycetaceae bacterium]
MTRGPSLGRDFRWLWASYAVSTVGTRLALDAFPFIALTLLHSGTTAVAALSAVGLAVGALVAVPLGPWVEFHRKRPVMVAADVVRCAALLSLPTAYAVGRLTYAQLIVVSVVVAAANIVFTAASGACLKALVPPESLLVANARFESTMWTATVLGPPLGGAAVGVFGALTTVVLDAVSYLLSALGIRAIGGREERPVRTERRGRLGEVAEGWRFILRHPRLRLLFFNMLLVNGLIMAPAPLLAVLMLRDLGFAPWQYGLAFGVPCLGGLAGARLARPLAAKYGSLRVLLASGVLRVCWSLGLVCVRPGVAGLVLVIVVEFGLIASMGVFTPVFATYRLGLTPTDRVARMLAAWSITGGATTAALTVCWGLLGAAIGVRTALGLAGGLLLATPLLLVRLARRERAAACGAGDVSGGEPRHTPVLRP